MGKNRELVDRAWRLLENKDLERIGEVFAADVEFNGPGGISLRGTGQMRPFLGAWLSAFPDMKHEIVTSVENEDTIALELRIVGTHTGVLPSPKGDIPATNRSVRWDSADFIRVAGGKIAFWASHLGPDHLPAPAGPAAGALKNRARERRGPWKSIEPSPSAPSP
jgi:ketosteroid isomerase-like protein